MRKVNLMAASSAIALLAAGSALAADPVEREGMNLVVYGQINYSTMYAESGNNDGLFIGDSDSSSSRFGFKAKGNINENWQLGARIELEVETSALSDVTWTAQGAGANTLGLRHAFWYVKGPIGKISVGQQSMVSDGTGNVDFSGTGAIDLNLTGISGSSIGADLEFGNSGVDIDQRLIGFDGNSRDGSIRYDTPSIAGFKLGASLSDINAFDVAIRYARQFGDFKIAAAASHVDFENSNASDTLFTSSAAIKHASGLNLSLGYADRNGRTNSDVETYNVKLGYSAALNEYGPTHFALGFAETEQSGVAGETNAYSFFIAQDISHLGSTFYAGYRNVEADDQADDVDIFVAGARVKF